jgi:hypothetical protein
MIVGTAPEGPEELALRSFDGKIVDAGETKHHETLVIEFPIFVAIGTEPLAGVVMILIGETYSDTTT